MKVIHSHSGLFGRSNSQAVLELYTEQLVRKIDPKKRSLKQFFHEEISEKFGNI